MEIGNTETPFKVDLRNYDGSIDTSGVMACQNLLWELFKYVRDETNLFDPAVRHIDGVKLLNKISATNSEFSKALSEASEKLSDIKNHHSHDNA